MKMVKKAVCKNCGVSFYSKFCISLHEYFHKKKSITTAGLYCDICGKRYNSAKIFENHLPHHGFCCFKDNCGEFQIWIIYKCGILHQLTFMVSYISSTNG